MNKTAQQLLDRLNSEYLELHQKFEELWWQFKMGDHSLEKAQTDAEHARDLFRADSKNLLTVQEALKQSGLSDDEAKRLKTWEIFFQLYQVPPELMPLRKKISDLESKVGTKLATRKEGYIDPKTKKFVEASKAKMRMIMHTNPDETLRRTCFYALEEFSLDVVDEYVQLVNMRNEFARALGFEDFYDYKLGISEGMTKEDVFSIFNEIYRKTEYAFDDVRKLEKEELLNLRKPWNFSHMMTGNFTLEEDPYYNFDDALMRWGRSFAAIGTSYNGGTLKLDLLDRDGKYNNGFCHYPVPVNYVGERLNPGSASFTCNVVYGQPGSGFQGMDTLFHEGMHGADRLCSLQEDICLNTEWPPASIIWAETHSQFSDTMFSSIEWRVRYAKNSVGEPYPFSLFEKKARKTRILAPHGLHSIMMVSEFEKRIYEAKQLSGEEAVSIAKEVARKYLDYSEDTLWILSVPHIYDWESSAYYHSYGLAVLALAQWRKYFYDKYGYIVDNPEVGREMNEVYKLGSSKTFSEFIELATGSKLSPEAFLEDATLDIEAFLARAHQRIKRMESIPEWTAPVNLDAKIQMVHGREVVADNSVSFEDMAAKYTTWLRTQKKHS